MNVSLSAPKKEQNNPRLQLLQLCFPVRLQNCSVDSDLTSPPTSTEGGEDDWTFTFG